MITSDYARTMATYNAWFNQRLYACCATLPEDALRQDRGAFFGSIFATLAHLVQVDGGFMAAFAKQPQPAQPAFESLAELRAARDALDARIAAWAAAVQPAWVAEQVTFASQVDGAPRTVPRAAMVMHMFNHQAHHRGQVTTLLSQAGVDVGLTDLHGSFEAPHAGEVRGYSARMDHPPHPIWRTRLASAGHYIAALVLLLKAVSYVDYPARPWLFIVLCLAGAAVIGGITFFHHALEARWPWVTSLIYFTECAVCAVLAVRTHLGGKEGLPYAWGVAAVMLAVQGVLVVRRALSHTPSGATSS